MKVAVAYHEEFGLSGDPVLRHRVIPSFKTLRETICDKQMKIITPHITPELIEAVQRVHTPAYLENVKKSGLYENALLSAASVMESADMLLHNSIQSTFAYTGCAGHHAGRNKFWGYCYLNDVAITIYHLRQKGLKRFLVLDIDPHFGDGTREFFQNDPYVIHINFFKGLYSELDARLHNYDYALRVGTDEEFLQILDRALNPEYLFDFMIVIFGHDSHDLDYGNLHLWDPTYPIIAEKIKKYAHGRPLLWALSGGSNIEVAQTVIPSVIKVLSD